MLVLGSMTNSSVLGFWLRFNESVNCDVLTLAMVPDTEEGSGALRDGPISAGIGADHREIAKQSMKKVASETAVRKRMLGYTSTPMDFDWVRGNGHEGGHRSEGIHTPREKEKKRVSAHRRKRARRYRYANCSLEYSLGGRVRAVRAL